MEYLHGQFVVHFDLKCDNLLCDLRDPSRPIVKIGDLGLSKVRLPSWLAAGLSCAGLGAGREAGCAVVRGVGGWA